MMKSCHNSRVYALSGPKGYWFSLSMGHTETIILSKKILKHEYKIPSHINELKSFSQGAFSIHCTYLHFHEIYILMNVNSYYGSTKVEKIPGDENANE